MDQYKEKIGTDTRERSGHGDHYLESNDARGRALGSLMLSGAPTRAVGI